MVKWNTSTIDWLLRGDTSIQYQTYRDLLDQERIDLQNRIETEGWGKQFLAARKENGHWGQAYYQPKWISTHYTLLDLKNLNISSNCLPIQETVRMVLQSEKGPDGGVRPIGATQKSDVCVNGMFLNVASYFKAEAKDLESIVDFLLEEYMPDGGFNCQSNRKGARHSSLHSTISVLEGIWEYQDNGYTYRLKALQDAMKSSVNFILEHRLYKSDKTGAIIDPRFLRLSYPSRWRYDILRALDFFRLAGLPFDKRMQDAIEVILNKRTKDGRWKLQAHHPGAIHFQMEEVRKPSRWNTLRALRVLKYYDKSNSHEK